MSDGTQSFSLAEEVSAQFIELIKTAIRAPTGSPSDGLGGETESSTSTSAFVIAQRLITAEKEGQDWEINETVIDGENPEHLHNERETGTPIRSDSSATHSLDNGGSHYTYHPPNFRTRIRWLFMLVVAFFNEKFDDPQTELDFRKLRWYSNKAWAFYGSMFLVVNWILYLALNLHSTSRTIYGQVIYYGGLTFLTVPVPFFVAMDMPFRSPILFHIWVTSAVWYCALTETIEMRVCDFFSGSQHSSCDGKDFLAEMYYATALPSIMLLVLTDRFYNAVFQVTEFILLLALVIPVQGIYARNVVSFVIFSIFSQGLHYNREMTERRLYLLNAQLKLAYKSQQKAQNAHFKASQAKRRFASYIFHEVRVPLNNMVVAFNNMNSHGAFRSLVTKDSGMSMDLSALDVSLTTVQQVLNDALDLEKMDAGHFDIHPRPFNLHAVIRSILSPICVSAAAKNLGVHINLDKNIDEVRPTADANHSLSPGADDDVHGQGTWVVGDDVRLRQILTNLASNAVKFTPDGAPTGITIKTKLIAHHVYNSRGASHTNGEGERIPDNGSDIDLERGEGGGGDGYDNDEEKKEQQPSQDLLVFRLEVSDSGPGIKPSDLLDNQLFQPFAQTKIGKSRQNSTGLGLAIVRQIVSLSGGKLGVHSRRGRGATFWMELFYPLATAAVIRQAISKENRASPSGLSLTIPGINVQSWPSIAFADDVKPPMLSGTVLRQPTPTSLLPPPLPSPPVSTLDYSLQPPSLTRTGSVGSDHPLIDKTPRNDMEQADADKPVSNDIHPDHKQSTLSLEHSTHDEGSEPEGPLVVLVVDDNQITRSTMSRALQKRGCEVHTARDGQECLNLVLAPDARRYDLVSLDNDMPVMTGEDAVKRLREVGRSDVFVVGLTGNALTDDQKRYLDAGANEVLIKPLNFHRLSEILDIARQKRRERRASAVKS